MRSLQWMLRHNAGYYVKHVQNGMDAMLNLHGLRAGKSKGCSINMRRHGIKTGLLFEKLVGSCHAGLTKKTSN